MLFFHVIDWRIQRLFWAYFIYVILYAKEIMSEKKPKHKDENAYADNAYKFVVVDVVIDDDAINKL